MAGVFLPTTLGLKSELVDEVLHVGERTPTTGTSDAGDSAEVSWDSDSERGPAKIPQRQALNTEVKARQTLSEAPRFINDLEMSRLNWKALSQGKEWRRELLLRGLPHRLCEKTVLKAFLDSQGFSDAVQGVRTVAGKGQKPGTALVRTTSAEAAARLAKFFHGKQLQGSSFPVAVSFADGLLSRGNARTNKTEPMRIETSTIQGAIPTPSEQGLPSLPAFAHLPPGLGMPPGLEELFVGLSCPVHVSGEASMW